MEEKDFEPAGLIPRSIIRTIERFRQQLRPETIALGIQEFRISRYQVRVSVRYFFILLLLPIAINWTAKTIIIKPLVGYFWNTHGTSLFLNSYIAERAFKEMRDFESQLFFETLVSNPPSCSDLNTNTPKKERLVYSTPSNLISSSLKNNSNEKFLHNDQMSLQPDFIRDQSFFFNKRQIHGEAKKIPELEILKLENTLKKDMRQKSSIQTKPKLNKTFLKPVEGEDHQQYQEILKINSSTTIFEKEDKKFIAFNLAPEKITNTIVSLPSIITPIKNLGLEMEQNFISSGHKGIGVEPYNSDFFDRMGSSNCFEVLFQEKTYLLAEIYNQQSITALSNMFADCIMIISIILLLRLNAPQFTILKSFLIESFYSFNDAIKCFYIILITDFLVGFHSPRGWEIVMEMLLRHLGLPENEEFILLFVGTFPVFLDTAFKYWIFRYLNKISPSTVATYHSMIE